MTRTSTGSARPFNCKWRTSSPLVSMPAALAASSRAKADEFFGTVEPVKMITVYTVEGGRRVVKTWKVSDETIQVNLWDDRKNLTLADSVGRVLAEGHGPKHGCSCC